MGVRVLWGDAKVLEAFLSGYPVENQRMSHSSQSFSCFKHGIKDAAVVGLTPVQNYSREPSLCLPHFQLSADEHQRCKF